MAILFSAKAAKRSGLTQALDAMWKIVASLSFFFLIACGAPDTPVPRQTQATRPPPPEMTVFDASPPDMSFLDALDGTCKETVADGVVLTAAEACWVKELAAQCSPANDCLVACLASGQARQTGGGCWHVCWPNVPGFDSWQEPRGAAQCKALDKVNGI